MSVIETDIVDYVYLDERELTPVLVVSDPLSWRPPDDASHLDLLRDKLNSQIAFVETGQIRGVWPGYAGGLVKVEVMARHALTRAAEEFYGLARGVMKKANMSLDFHLCDA
jgi:hypothetical protein